MLQVTALWSHGLTCVLMGNSDQSPDKKEKKINLENMEYHKFNRIYMYMQLTSLIDIELVIYIMYNTKFVQRFQMFIFYSFVHLTINLIDNFINSMCLITCNLSSSVLMYYFS